MSTSYESGLTIGVELEFPKAMSHSNKMTHRGLESNDIATELSRYGHVSTPGDVTTDPTVGLEYTSRQMDIEHGAGWLADSIEQIESEAGTIYAPCSLLPHSTAGLHVHLSNATEGEMRRLYRLSTRPEMQVLACSGIASDPEQTAPVFRSNYCGLDHFNNGRHSAVHRVSGQHWEWRLPEPTEPETFERVLKALDIVVVEGFDAAFDYVQNVLDNEADDLTSVKRAKAIGLEETPDNIPATVTRTPPGPNRTAFFDAVRGSNEQPYIFHVEYDGDVFYGFHTSSYDPLQERMVDIEDDWSFSFAPADVIRADSLEKVGDPDVKAEVKDAIERHRNGNQRNSQRETEATEEVKKLLKKDK